MLIVPGLALAAASSDCQSLKGLLAGTTTIIGTVLSMLTGAKDGTIEGLPAISGETIERAEGGDHHRVAVGRRLQDHLLADHAAGTGPVVDQYRLAELARDAIACQPRRHVGIAAGREGHDEADGLGREGLRPRAEAGRRRGRCRQSAQKKCPPLCHDVRPPHFVERSICRGVAVGHSNRTEITMAFRGMERSATTTLCNCVFPLNPTGET